ncbi:MAG: hypothetical protein ISN64_01175 [Rickettsia sp.]|nr:hypothetical protein [Rickettsia sp.]
MIKSKEISITFCILMILSINKAHAEEFLPEKEFLSEREYFENIEKEYESYLSEIPKEVRTEIIDYRKKIISLNKQKIILYNKLSQESQKFLQKEEEFKKKLAFDKK